MAIIPAVFSNALSGAGADVYVWSDVTESDTCAAIQPPALMGLAGALQVTGTFGGGTATIEASIDGATFAAIKDTSGTAIGKTAAGFADFATAATFIRPAMSGGTSQSVTFYVVIRRD